jgi:hypothetical protein
MAKDDKILDDEEAQKRLKDMFGPNYQLEEEKSTEPSKEPTAKSGQPSATSSFVNSLVQGAGDVSRVVATEPTLAGVAGATVGAKLGPTVQNVLGGTLTPPPPTPARTPYNPRGVSVENSVANWKNYQNAQSEAAKGVVRNTEMRNKFPNFTRALPEPPPQNIMQKILSPLEAMGQKLGAVSSAMGQKTGPRLGGALSLGGGALQGSESYNRQQQGDIPGAIIAGAGAVGSAASMLPPVSPPTAIAKGVGATAAFASPFALMLYDYLRKQNPTIGQPSSQTDNSMGASSPYSP